MKDNIVSELELTEDGGKDQNHFTNKSEGKEENVVQENQNVSILERVKKLFKFFTVEPFLLCYIVPNIISALAVQKLNLEKACRSDLNFTEAICSVAYSGDIPDGDNITTAALNGAQIMVADMTAWQRPLQSGIPAIAILFVGAWSDKTGNRKNLMLVPLIGELISCVGLLLATYFFLEWPLWVTALIEALPTAFSGGFPIALMGSYSYMADVTTVESRTYRIGIVAVIVTLGIPLGSSISGVLTEAVGYYGIFGIQAVLYVLAFIHTYFRVHDVKRVPMEGSFSEKIINFFHPKHAWVTISLLFTSPRAQLIQILLVIWAHIVIMGPVNGEHGVMFLYVLKKYNMTLVEFSLYSTYSILVGLAGTFIAVLIFSKWLKMHDAVIGVIATTCKVMSCFVFSLAPTKTWFFMGPLFDFFGNSGTTVIRSLGTKVVEQDQVGKMCSLIGLVDAIIPVIYVPLYSKVYTNTLETFTGAFFLLGAFMTVPAFFIFIYLYIVQRRQTRDIVQNPKEKERHAHDNYATAL